MSAAASFILALLHLLLWVKDRKAYVYLLSVVIAVSAGAGALTELALMHADSINAYRKLIQCRTPDLALNSMRLDRLKNEA